MPSGSLRNGRYTAPSTTATESKTLPRRYGFRGAVRAAWRRAHGEDQRKLRKGDGRERHRLRGAPVAFATDEEGDERGGSHQRSDQRRCAYLDAAKKRDQLKRCADHIAKGIYARVADIRPADFAELVRYVDLLRRNYYLDGPNDVDWLFRNEIMAEREERLYVDYVETDEGDMWISPRRYDDIGPRYASGAVELVGALSRAGMSDERALHVVADIWRDFQPVPDTHWQENVELTRATL